MARVFPFILKAKHKTLHIIWAWAWVGKFCRKTICMSFDWSSLIFDRSNRERRERKERIRERKESKTHMWWVTLRFTYLVFVEMQILLEVFDYVAGDFSEMKKRFSHHQILKWKAQSLCNEDIAKIRILFFILSIFF